MPNNVLPAEERLNASVDIRLSPAERAEVYAAYERYHADAKDAGNPRPLRRSAWLREILLAGTGVAE